MKQVLPLTKTRSILTVDFMTVQMNLLDLRDSREFHRTYRLFIAETLINLVGPFTSAFCLRDLEERVRAAHIRRA